MNSFIPVKYLQHHTEGMGHSGQVGGSLQQRGYPPTSDSSLNSLISRQSFLSSVHPCIPTTITTTNREKSTSTNPRLAFDLLLVLFSEMLLAAHFRLTMLSDRKRDICTI